MTLASALPSWSRCRSPQRHGVMAPLAPAPLGQGGFPLRPWVGRASRAEGHPGASLPPPWACSSLDEPGRWVPSARRLQKCPGVHSPGSQGSQDPTLLPLVTALALEQPPCPVGSPCHRVLLAPAPQECRRGRAYGRLPWLLLGLTAWAGGEQSGGSGAGPWLGQEGTQPGLRWAGVETRFP